MLPYDWTCQVCDAVNASDCGICTTCGAPNTLSADQVQARKASWDAGEPFKDPARPNILILAVALIIAAPVVGLVRGAIWELSLDLPSTLHLAFATTVAWGILNRKRWASTLYVLLVVTGLLLLLFLSPMYLLTSIASLEDLLGLLPVAILGTPSVRAWFDVA